MTFYDVYIGNRSGGRISPLFPPAPGGTMEDKPFWRVIRGIEQGRFRGRQVDWGSWEAKVSKRTIKQFVDDVYPGYESREPDSYGPNSPGSVEELREFVDNLEPGKQYTLVAAEL